MRKLSLLLSLVVAAGMLAACKGDARNSTWQYSKDAGTVEGYEGGTPITLLDGTPVTLVDGTPVTSPKVKDVKSGGTTKTTKGDDISDSEVANPVGGTTNTTRSGSGTGTTDTTFKTTGTTIVVPVPNRYRLALPKTGVYGFRQTIIPDDGGSTNDDGVYYRYAGDGGQTVRIQSSDAQATSVAQDYFAETYTNEGLFLTDSALYGEPCVWSPRAISLPQSVIDGGPKVTSKSSCSTTVNNQPATFELEVTVAFKRLKTVRIGTKDYAAIDVTRHRVLKHAKETITSDAIDTYVFDLGIRVATSDHSTSEDGKSVRGGTRNLVLTSIPS